MNWHYFYLFMQVYALELIFLIFLFKGEMSLSRRCVVVLLANAFTHPLVFFGFMHMPGTYLSDIALSETFAILSEGAIYQFVGIKARTAWIGSLGANLLSWQIGPILTALVFLRDRLA